MLGRSNTNVTVNGPTLELNSEYFSYPGSSLQPMYTKSTLASCRFTDFPTLPADNWPSLYKEYMIYRSGGPISQAFTIDFTPVRWKYRKVTIMGYFHTTGTRSGNYNMKVYNNNKEMCYCPTYYNDTSSPCYLLEIDLETDPVLIISGSSYTNSDVSFRLINCIGYFR